jgi:hypothetical protein
MRDYQLWTLLNNLICVAAVIAIIRIRNIDRQFLPFVFLVWSAASAELISTQFSQRGYTNAPVVNLYSLAEFLLIIWQFARWRLFTNKNILLGLATGAVILWTVENLLVSDMQKFNTYTVILFGFVFVLFSISMLNRIIINESGSLLKNPIFLLCLAFIIYFTFSSIVEIFWIYGLDKSKAFRASIYNIFVYVNLFINLLYTVVMLVIPKKTDGFRIS